VPYRLKIRSPSFVNLSILPKLLPGHMIADVAAILGSLDFVMGESDR
jgi:NADH-quinone oxidoreductase subunit D